MKMKKCGVGEASCIHSLPTVVKSSNPHSLDGSIGVCLGEDPDLPSERGLGRVPQDHHGLAMAVPTHTTQHPA